LAADRVELERLKADCRVVETGGVAGERFGSDCGIRASGSVIHQGVVAEECVAIS